MCRSTDPRDKRLRPSIYLDVPSYAQILVDAGPDLRQQALTFGVKHVDAILLTHSHADHILGLDEVRRFNAVAGGPIPCYASPSTWETVWRTFHYVFDGVEKKGGGIPRIDAHEIRSPLSIKGVRVVPVPVWHGEMPVLGFRFGDFAYLTDCNRIEELFPAKMLVDLPHPVVLIDDAHVNIAGVYSHFHQHGLDRGDYLIVEDIVPWIPGSFGKAEDNIEWGDWKWNEIRGFFAGCGDAYLVDRYYTDFFGYNATWNWNGFLKKM